jgi:hypothetical protein
MFIGHYAVALAAKKVSPKISLGTLFLSAQFVDLLWPLFLLLGWEHVRIKPGDTAFTPLDFYDYPISHSLLAAIGWSLFVGMVYAAVRRYRAGAIVAACCVFSHWLLDALTHRPDLPLNMTGGTRVGLGLWNSVAGSVIVEGLLFVAGVVIYVRSTTARDGVGRYGFWLLLVVLVCIYVANMAGPPPPDPGVIAIAGNAGWLFVVWAYWIDRHRLPANPDTRGNA